MKLNHECTIHVNAFKRFANLSELIFKKELVGLKCNESFSAITSLLNVVVQVDGICCLLRTID